MRAWATRLLAALAVTATPWGHNAAAAPGALSKVEEGHPGHHHAAFPNLVGLRVGFVSLVESPQGGAEYSPGVLVGVSYERTLVHEWLELELTAPVAVAFAEERVVALPIDLHFKKPFHPSPHVSPYLAAGPAFDVQLRPQAAVLFGASVAIGTYVWPTRRVGIDIEVDYNVVAERGKAVHEFVVAAGPVVRF